MKNDKIVKKYQLGEQISKAGMFKSILEYGSSISITYVGLYNKNTNKIKINFNKIKKDGLDEFPIKIELLPTKEGDEKDVFPGYKLKITQVYGSTTSKWSNRRKTEGEIDIYPIVSGGEALDRLLDYAVGDAKTKLESYKENESEFILGGILDTVGENIPFMGAALSGIDFINSTADVIYAYNYGEGYDKFSNSVGELNSGKDAFDSGYSAIKKEDFDYDATKLGQKTDKAFTVLGLLGDYLEVREQNQKFIKDINELTKNYDRKTLQRLANSCAASGQLIHATITSNVDEEGALIGFVDGDSEVSHKVNFDNVYIDEEELKYRLAVYKENHKNGVTINDIKDYMVNNKTIGDETVKKILDYSDWYTSRQGKFINTSCFKAKWGDVCEKNNIDVSKYNVSKFDDDVLRKIYKFDKDTNSNFDISILEKYKK